MQKLHSFVFSSALEIRMIVRGRVRAYGTLSEKMQTALSAAFGRSRGDSNNCARTNVCEAYGKLSEEL